ncbi:hypothetical protein BC829DRAFT_492004 [Chytridium lagenaria]|nr:hypothetical protein BC829DRAFT_492004 [Chytridium lagenaria]
MLRPEKNAGSTANPKVLGDIVWRQVFPEDENIVAFGQEDAYVVTTTSAEKDRLRRWDATSGYLLWDAELPKLTNSAGPSGSYAVGYVASTGTQKDVIGLSGYGVLKRFGGSSGKKNFGSHAKMLVTSKSVFVLSQNGAAVEVTEVDVQDGKVQSTFPVTIYTATDGSVRILSLLSKDVLTLKAKDVFATSTSDLIATPLHATADSAEFVLSSGVESEIFAIKSGKPQKIAKLASSKSSETSKFSVSVDNVEKFAARFRSAPGEKEGLLELVTLSSGKVFGPYAIPINPRFGSIEKVDASSAKFRDAQPGYRLFALTSSGTFFAAKADETLWNRYESLSDSVGSVFVDLPESRLLSLDHDELNEPVRDTEALNPVSRYLKRWGTHVQQLSSLMASLPDTLKNVAALPASLFALKNSTILKSTEVILQRDRYGFRKLLIFGSKSGNVVAVETEHGNVAWTTYLPGLKVRQVESIRSGVVRFPPLVAIIADNGKETSFIYLNALTGEFAEENEMVEKLRISGVPAQVIKLPIQEEKDGLFPFVAVDKNLKVTVVPDTPEAHAAFKSIISDFYFYLTEGVGADGIHGYFVTELAKGVYVSKPVWEVKFGGNEKVAALAPRDLKEKIASMGRVLGNRQVLYKYLNPNVLAVATVREAAKTTNLYLYLIDTVTGSIFHRAAFPGAGNIKKGTNSIYLAQTEHNVVLSFYNHGPDAAETIVEPEEDVIEDEDTIDKKKKRKRKAKKVSSGAPDVKGHEVVILEVFESVKPNSRMDSAQRPQILSQSYVFPIPINAVGFTDTKAGITTKELLLGLETNQLYGINKRFLDVRRPVGSLTADDREETLVAYRPVLDYNPRDVVSYNLDVAGIKTIVASPSEIESTSLVAAYGLDLFVARRSPSKVFDVLSEDFNYASLILTIIVLLIGIQVAKYFAARKRLFDQWI